MFSYIRTALQSIWHHKIRSLLTVLGVVIGVSSVTTLVALGQGLKNDVSSLIQSFGTNVIVITSGNISMQGGQRNPANFISGDILTEEDVRRITALEEVEAVSPIGLIPGNIRFGEQVASPVIYGAYPNILEAFEVLRIDQGRMFDTGDTESVIVMSGTIAEQLFDDEEVIGNEVTIGEKNFEVIGTLEVTKSSSLFGSELESMSIIPFEQVAGFYEGSSKIMRIVIKAEETADVAVVKEKIDTLMSEYHEDEEYSVLTQDDLLGLFNDFLNLSTTLVSAIAAISLIVGGIGIMNIMLVTVTERTKEIGLRKAVGAPKVAILVQFLVEAVVVTLLGGIIGLGVSLIAGWVVAYKTPLTPDITPQIVLIAVGISTIIGVVFGLWPAVRAANKDPIEALRNE